MRTRVAAISSKSARCASTCRAVQPSPAPAAPVAPADPSRSAGSDPTSSRSSSRSARRAATDSVVVIVQVQAELLAGVVVELAVQLAAVRAAVELAHEPLLPHRVADHPRLLDQDLLLQAPDHLLPCAPLAGQLLVQDDQAV